MTKSFDELALISVPYHRRADPERAERFLLLAQASAECLPQHKNHDQLLEQAVAIAKRILDGEIQPNVGCAQIGDINRALDWPKVLSAFGLLAHEQHDHENIGITAEGCIPEIIAECQALIARFHENK